MGLLDGMEWDTSLMCVMRGTLCLFTTVLCVREEGGGRNNDFFGKYFHDLLISPQTLFSQGQRTVSPRFIQYHQAMIDNIFFASESESFILCGFKRVFI